MFDVILNEGMDKRERERERVALNQPLRDERMNDFHQVSKKKKKTQLFSSVHQNSIWLHKLTYGADGLRAHALFMVLRMTDV